MFNIFIALAAVAILILYFIIIKPLVPLLILKVKLGDKAMIMFRPLTGGFALFKESEKKHHDILHEIYAALRKNPQTKVILTNFIHKPLLLVTGPEYIKEMYTNHHDYVKVDPFMLPNFLNKGLLMSEGHDWKRQRKFLGTAFTFEKLKARLPIINEVVNYVDQTNPKNHLNQFASQITGEVVIHSFFGPLAKGFQLEGKPAQVALIELTTEAGKINFENTYVFFKQMIFGSRSWEILPTLREKQLLQRVEVFKKQVTDMIMKRIEQLRSQKLENEDDMVFLDLYVTEYLKSEQQSLKQIDIDEIINQFITLFFAGTDTTATLSGTCLFYFAKYPEFQEEILQEIKQVVGEGDVKEDHINKLEKLHAFIQEVLRLTNPAFAPLIRQVRNDKTLLDIKLKKGWYIWQQHSASSQLEKHFKNPEKFDYKRWLTNKEVIQNDNGFIHIPFGAGQRNCIGQHMALIEAKTILSILVRKYQIQMNPNTKQHKFGLKFLYCVEPDDCVIYKKRD